MPLHLYDKLFVYISCMYLRSQVSVYKTNGPMVFFHSGPVFKVDVALAFLKAIYNCSFDTSDAMKRTISRVGLNMYRKSGRNMKLIVLHTVSGHNYSPNSENSIDLHVSSCLQEKIFPYIYVFGVI